MKNEFASISTSFLMFFTVSTLFCISFEIVYCGHVSKGAGIKDREQVSYFDVGSRTALSLVPVTGGVNVDRSVPTWVGVVRQFQEAVRTVPDACVRLPSSMGKILRPSVGP